MQFGLRTGLYANSWSAYRCYGMKIGANTVRQDNKLSHCYGIVTAGIFNLAGIKKYF
jgi:hypothetical protein